MRSMILSLSLLLVLTGAAGQTFERFFLDKTLRVDYYHTGTKGMETLALDKASLEGGAWPGSLVNLLDTLNMGEYMLRVYDQATGALIYTRGFSSMFQEWQTTDEALAGVTRTFHETVRMPFPKRKVQITLARRDRRMAFHEVFSASLDPADPVQVNRERVVLPHRMVPLMESGDPHRKVDIVIMGDGYRREDMEKFRKDAKHFNDLMFSTSPFKERKGDFNVWTVEVVSADSGIDKPDKGIWKTTALGTAYNTFGSARYVLTEENRALRDIAGLAPYDFITILVNDNRYGGGGIYNLYTTTYTRGDAPGMDWQMDYVYVHEFGHSFGGLGDEYYSSQVSYNDMYQKGVEPWEPNLTALTNPASLKWGHLVGGGTPLPTPWEKARYDSLRTSAAKLDRLAPDYYQMREPIYKAEADALKGSAYADRVGAFEGAGYMATGLYRPSVDCRMFTLSLVDFDPVCREAIIRSIDFYAR